MMIFWAITPLQSAVFNIGTVSRTRHAQMITTGSLIPMSSQATILNANFMNTAYGFSWLSQKLPAYTTESYILRPYAPVNYDPNVLYNETWKASTLAYGTKLACKPANMSFNSTTVGYTFDNGAGCTTQEIYLPGLGFNATFTALYIQYWDNAEDDWALQNPHCSTDQSHNFLALSSDASSSSHGGEYSNLTALFCQTSYFEVEVTAEVNGTDQSVVSSNFSMDSSKTKDLPDGFFNVTHFEYIIGTGVSPITSRQDFQNVRPLEQYPRVFRYGLTWPVSNMVGFAVAANSASNNTIENLSDPLILQEAFEKAHRLLFSTAISTLTQFSTINGSNETWDGLRVDNPAAITYTREFAIVVEASLSIIAFLTCALWYHTYRRPNKLTSDPAASIASMMSLVRHSKGLSHLFQDDGTVTEEVLKCRLCQKRFLLSSSATKPDMRLNVQDDESSAGSDETREIRGKSPNEKPKGSKMVRPVEMSWGAGVALLTLILGSICVLTVSYVRVVEGNGLPRPTANTLLLSLLENALPTAIASILEPLWVVLNRLLCVLRPFEDLRIGNASPSRTIEAQYTSIPPQLVFWRALRSRHLMLAAVCAVAISSNVLAVSLGGLFNEAPTPVLSAIVLSQTMAATFNGSSEISKGNTHTPIEFKDHFYVILANLKEGNSLPAWIDNRMFYVPFDLPSRPDQYAFASSQGASQLQTFAGPSRGFGVVAKCQPGGVSASNRTIVLDLMDHGPDGPAIVVSVSQMGANGSITTLQQVTVNFDPTLPLSYAASASEVVVTLDTQVVFGWVRIGPAVSNTSSTSNLTTNGRSFDYTLMLCSPQIVTAGYDVVVDPAGHIISATQTTPLDQNTTVYSTTMETTNLLSQFNSLIAGPTNVLWHTDLFTSDWINSVLKAYINSTDFLDASQPPPDIKMMIPAVEDIYQRLAATIFGITPNLFLPASPNATVNTSISLIETRIFMSTLMFEISTTILSLHLLTAAFYYLRRPKRFLPRMPTTIASLFAYVSMSHTIEDTALLQGTKELSQKASAGMGAPVSAPTAPKPPEARQYGYGYSYGRFIGVDGKPHVGIDRSSRVVPLQTENPEFRRRRGWNRVRTWLLRDGKDPQQTWI